MARRTRRQWQALVARFDDSGWTHQEFADEHGLNVGTFRSWLYRLRREEQSADGEDTSGFVELRSDDTVSRPSRLAMTLPGGVRLEFDDSVDPAWVAQLCRCTVNA